MKIKTKFGTANINQNGYYRIVSSKEGYFSRLLHVITWEEEYQTKLPKNYVIHHINGNKLCNEIWNLQCVEDKVHKRFHAKGKRNSAFRKDVPSGKELYEENIPYRRLSEKYNCSISCINSRIHEYKKQNNIKKKRVGRYDLPDNSYFKMLYYSLGLNYNNIKEIMNCGINTARRRVQSQ